MSEMNEAVTGAQAEHDGEGDRQPSRRHERRPVLVIGLGTAAIFVLRSLQSELGKLVGGVPPFGSLLGMDTTAQGAADGLPPLADAAFLNLAGLPSLKPRLNAAVKDRRRYPYLTPEMARLSLGDGAGGVPAIARFLLEEMLPKLTRRIESILGRFVGAERIRLAEESNQLPWLRENGITLSPEGRIDVIFVTSAVGGTAGIVKYVAALVQWLAAKMGLDVDCSLILSPPAVAEGGTRDGGGRGTRCGARFQELADLNLSGGLEWQLPDGSTIAHAGPLFSHVFLPPEPVSGTELDRHYRFVAEYLAQLFMPVGKTLADRAVDMPCDVYCDKGQFGQPRLLAAFGMARLKATAYEDPVDFAEAHLGAVATGSGAIDAESESAQLLARHGLTAAALEAQLPKVECPEIPARVNAANAEAFLGNARRTLDGEVGQKARQSAQAVAGQFSQFEAALKKSAVGLAIRLGVGAAAGLAGATSRSLNLLETQLMGRRAGLAPSGTARPADATAARLESIAAECRATAARTFWDAVLEALAATRGRVEALDGKFSSAAECLEKQRRQYQERRRAYARTPAEPNAVLDKAALVQIVRSGLQGCVGEVRRSVLQELGADGNARSLASAVSSAVRRHAEHFATLADIDAAIRQAGPRAEETIRNFLVAAEPRLRPFPGVDHRHGVRSWLFVTVKADHVVTRYARLTERQVGHAGRSPHRGEIVAIAVDFGIEIASLALTREAFEAVVRRESAVSAFADADYRPRSDLLVPPPGQRWLYVAMPLHLRLQTGRLKFDEFRGWLWDDRVRLGESYVEAFETLTKKGGRGGLPTPDDLMEEAESLLLVSGRTRAEILDLLTAVERTLDEQLERGGIAERYLVMQQRAAARVLRAELAARVAAAETYRQLYGSPVEPPSAVPSPNGRDGHPAHSPNMKGSNHEHVEP